MTPRESPITDPQLEALLDQLLAPPAPPAGLVERLIARTQPLLGQADLATQGPLTEAQVNAHPMAASVEAAIGQAALPALPAGLTDRVVAAAWEATLPTPWTQQLDQALAPTELPTGLVDRVFVASADGLRPTALERRLDKTLAAQAPPASLTPAILHATQDELRRHRSVVLRFLDTTWVRSAAAVIVASTALGIGAVSATIFHDAHRNIRSSESLAAFQASLNQSLLGLDGYDRPLMTDLDDTQATAKVDSASLSRDINDAVNSLTREIMMYEDSRVEDEIPGEEMF